MIKIITILLLSSYDLKVMDIHNLSQIAGLIVFAKYAKYIIY